ncbi:hypothetical protein M9H77_34608 [Catharanthus roseus]|uniref:Uncharacterized protein n=1 Tax=Catharanthus roseus TaxID=4058 RepID=A0ACB9ZLX8_CATRO|nr:hypothetical protein M9H77_34608 [Catharanthus roseus]
MIMHSRCALLSGLIWSGDHEICINELQCRHFGHMHPDFLGSLVPVSYLSLLGILRTSAPTVGIGGALVLLQVWVWSRILVLRPQLYAIQSSFQAPLPPGTMTSSFQAPPPPGTMGSSTPHMPISYASSSDSDEHDDKRTDDVTPAQQLGFGHRVGKKTTSMNNDNKMCYLWTITPNLVKEGIQVLVEFIPLQRRTDSITHDTNTINMTEHVTTITQMVFYEPSMLYPAVDDDDDENDHSDEEYVISSESESDGNNDVEEEELQTPINRVTKNTVTQWESSQWFSSARYDYTQSGDS